MDTHTYRFYSSAVYGYCLELRSRSGVFVIVKGTGNDTLDDLIEILLRSREFFEDAEVVNKPDKPAPVVSVEITGPGAELLKKPKGRPRKYVEATPTILTNLNREELIEHVQGELDRAHKIWEEQNGVES